LSLATGPSRDWPEAAKLADMKHKPLQALTLAIAFCFLGAMQATSATPDEEAVAQTLRLMYVALTKEDTAQLRAVTTSDFHAFDVGQKMTGDELLSAIKSAHAAGKTFVWTVTEPTVRIEGVVAWITYTNIGSIQDSAGKRDVSWLESAVLLKNAGTWRIQFFHSTRVPAK
jgi:SnoaL-like domain